ncbi:hypothetical protein MLC59_01920 [Marinobacter bryozoorum]|uniref:hypothetical protein n=1 Tax=Marinobacter bryozoorum TaxID=256324 RepID=UPI0020066DE8|nr:hypothetical protein [Marinobacter bryozoorum]MCK7542927.1 hypothetical protein [Marinobacter bryozoorum]
MDQSAARTILTLNAQRNRLEDEKRQALLAQAEMEHELRMLRHMRQEILYCLLEPRKNRKTEQGARHTVARVARILRNTNQREVKPC